MAHLDTVVVGFEEFLFHKRKATSGQIKRFTCQRAQKIYEIIHSAPLFIFSIIRTKLCNIFTSSKPHLDSAVIYDLLNYPSIGTKRMLHYVEVYILPQQATHQKCKRQLKLSTFSSRTQTKQEQESRKRVAEHSQKCYGTPASKWDCCTNLHLSSCNIQHAWGNAHGTEEYFYKCHV